MLRIYFSASYLSPLQRADEFTLDLLYYRNWNIRYYCPIQKQEIVKIYDPTAEILSIVFSMKMGFILRKMIPWYILAFNFCSCVSSNVYQCHIL